MIARDLFVPLKVNGEGSFQNTISILFQTGKFEFFGILLPPLMAIILNILMLWQSIVFAPKWNTS